MEPTETGTEDSEHFVQGNNSKESWKRQADNLNCMSYCDA